MTQIFQGKRPKVISYPCILCHAWKFLSLLNNRIADVLPINERESLFHALFVYITHCSCFHQRGLCIVYLQPYFLQKVRVYCCYPGPSVSPSVTLSSSSNSSFNLSNSQLIFWIKIGDVLQMCNGVLELSNLPWRQAGGKKKKSDVFP